LTFDNSISYTPLNNARYIAATGDTVHVVWHDLRDGNWEIYYKRSTDRGSSFGPDTRLTNDSAESVHPSIAVSGPFVHVVWYDSRDGNYEIYYKCSTDGGSNFGPDTRLTFNPNFSCSPSIAVQNSFDHVVWHDKRDGNWEVYYIRSTDGGVSWGQETRLTYNPDTSQFASVAVTGSNVHVVWHENRSWVWEIYYKRSTDFGTTWGSDTCLSNSPEFAKFPSMATSGSVIHLVWYDMRLSDYEIYYSRSTDGGRSFGPVMRLTNATGYSSNPSIAASGSIVHVAWQDERNGGQIFYKRSTDEGENFSPDTCLTNSSSYNAKPSIAFSGSAVHIVWNDFRDSNWEIYYKRNLTGNSGVEDGEPLSLTTGASRFTVFPNPFTSFASISGHSSERFALYDISGRKVGVYSGDRIAWDVSPGVYFLRPEGKDAKPLRVVKVR